MDVAGERRRVFVVVTREARDAPNEVHDRMPAFLTRDLWDEWLNPAPLRVDGDTAASKAKREHLLGELDNASQLTASTMRTHEVDRRVNNSRTAPVNDVSLIQPLT